MSAPAIKRSLPPLDGPPHGEERSAGRESAPEVDDATLVHRALDGDRRAEEALFRRHVRAVTGTIVRMLGDPVEAEDVAQDTFLTALAELGDLRNPKAVRGWLVRIAVNKVHRRFRRRRLRRALGLDRGTPPGLETLATESTSPERRAELALLSRELESISPARRVAWVLRHVEGYSLAEAADACGCSLATVKRRIAAADARIRAHVALAPPREATDE